MRGISLLVFQCNGRFTVISKIPIKISNKNLYYKQNRRRALKQSDSSSCTQQLLARPAILNDRLIIVTSDRNNVIPLK